MSHANISIFVPHVGCPNQCSFCNQYCITGHTAAPTVDDVRVAVKTAVASGVSSECEIAFFGGSFTAIERGYMTELLAAAKPFVDDGTVRGIRISTRPDAIDDEVLRLVKGYGVTAIELGAQSMNDKVLQLNRRGHTAEDVERAAGLIKAAGFELGLQMMTALYGSSDADDTQTARRFIELEPDTVRIYPTIVLRGTYLAELAAAGSYIPDSVEHASDICAELLMLFRGAGVRVIRTGLHTIDEGSFVGGPWHPAFGEICESKIYRRIIAGSLQAGRSYTVFVAPSEVSKAIGQHRSNVEYFSTVGCTVAVRPDLSLKKYEVKTEEAKG